MALGVTSVQGSCLSVRSGTDEEGTNTKDKVQDLFQEVAVFFMLN